MISSANIRPAAPTDHEAIWTIFHAVAAAGDSYTFDSDISRREALDYWLAPNVQPFVADCEGTILGTYILRPNQPGRGGHVANAAFMVSSAGRGLGIGRRLGEHCLAQARQQGFRAMQFNFVVSTNATAIRLWRSLGFATVGTLPGAFRHAEFGFVDAHIMFRSLVDV